MKNLEEFNGKHQGKTCFIIGAGPSIRHEFLDPLKNHVTIAVNSGYVAVPWADFFISDDWSIAHWSFFFRDLRQSDTTHALLYEDKLADYTGWFGDRSVLFRHKKGISIPDRYEHDKSKYHIGETRTSVGSAIMAAHCMGCKEIVLVGIDCRRQDGFRYFWQFPDSEFKVPYRNDGVPIDKYKKVKQMGLITDSDLIEISRTWDAFGMALNKKCKVYNASEISTIRVFPKVQLKDFIND